jgi:hypothetical protein
MGLEMGDELTHRLLGHLRPLGEDADPRAAVVEELEDVSVRDADLWMPLLREPRVDVLGHLVERLAQEAAEVQRRI